MTTTRPTSARHAPQADAAGDALDLEFAAAARAIAAAGSIWLATHVDPDGDAIGSMLGLRSILVGMGKRVTAACQDPPPPEIAFLPGLEHVRAVPPNGHELAVALDAADFGRLGNLVEPDAWSRATTLCIDHHASSTRFGTINLVDTSAASASEVVLRLADELGASVSPEAATYLLAGIVTDTISFRTANTRPETLDHARRLMSLGAPLAAITQGVFFTRPLAALQLLARAVERLEFEGTIAVTTLRLRDFDELGMPPAAARGITEQLATASEPLVMALVREREDGTADVSLRSKPGIDVLPAALALGGGGHPQAAGARWASGLDDAVRAVWSALRAHVRLPDGDARP